MAQVDLSARPARVLLAVGIILIANSAPANAESGPGISFDLDRRPGAEACPDHDSLAAQVVQRLASSAASHRAPVADRVAITVLREADAYVASLSVRGLGGRDGSTRSFVDTGQNCAGLSEALALTLAMISDGMPLFDRKAAVASSPPMPPVPVTPPSQAMRRPWELGAGALGASNLLGAPTVGYGVAAIWRPRPHLAAGVKAIWMPARTIDKNGGRTKVSVEAGLASACWGILAYGRRFIPALCGELGGGVLQGSSEGYADSQTATRLWLGAGAFANAGIRISNRWSVAAQGGVLLSLRSESFTIGGLGSPVYEPSRFGWLAEIDLRVRIW